MCELSEAEASGELEVLKTLKDSVLPSSTETSGNVRVSVSDELRLKGELEWRSWEKLVSVQVC